MAKLLKQIQAVHFRPAINLQNAIKRLCVDAFYNVAVWDGENLHNPIKWEQKVRDFLILLALMKISRQFLTRQAVNLFHFTEKKIRLSK